MAADTVEYISGEKKNIGIEVNSIFNEEFTITSATFTLTRESDDVVVISETATRYTETVGSSTICKEVYYLLDSTSLDLGKYVAEFTYIVNTETVKYRVDVYIMA